MARKFSHNQQRRKRPPSSSRHSAAPAEPPKVYEKKPPTVYGKPFVVMEDQQKNTFKYATGGWLPYTMTIAECRVDCQVKELPQKVNGMTRYEVRCPVGLEP